MAGKAGRSGGARPGAGRPSKEPLINLSTALLTKDPKEFLTAVMNDPQTDMKLRAEATKTLMPFVHQRVGDVGKKEAVKEAANKVLGGIFAPKQPSRLVVNNR